jgi:hypothetical protein
VLDLKAGVHLAGEFGLMVFFFAPCFLKFLYVELQGQVQWFCSPEQILVDSQGILKSWHIIVLRSEWKQEKQ